MPLLRPHPEVPVRVLDALDRTSPSIGGPMNICRTTPDGAHHLDEKEIEEARERVRRWVDLERRRWTSFQ